MRPPRAQGSNLQPPARPDGRAGALPIELARSGSVKPYQTSLTSTSRAMSANRSWLAGMHLGQMLRVLSPRPVNQFHPLVVASSVEKTTAGQNSQVRVREGFMNVFMLIILALLLSAAYDCDANREPPPGLRATLEARDHARWCATPRPGDVDWEDLCGE